jgi:hypothetical protein
MPTDASNVHDDASFRHDVDPPLFPVTGDG